MNYNLDNIKDIKEYCYNNYGSYCGLVIQYIFNYSRNLVDKND